MNSFDAGNVSAICLPTDGMNFHGKEVYKTSWIASSEKLCDTDIYGPTAGHFCRKQTCMTVRQIKPTHQFGRSEILLNSHCEDGARRVTKFLVHSFAHRWEIAGP